MISACAAMRWFGYDRTMKDGPNIVRIAALIGDQARAEMLTALMADRALTATELAGWPASPSRPSARTSRSWSTRAARGRGQGRHRYFRLADRDVAQLLEIADGRRLSHRRRPRARRPARAGAAQGARLLRPPRRRARRARLRRACSRAAGSPTAPAASALTTAGRRRFCASSASTRGARAASGARSAGRASTGASAATISAGALGAALLDALLRAGLGAARAADSRVVVFTPRGEQQWRAAFAA